MAKHLKRYWLQSEKQDRYGDDNSISHSSYFVWLMTNMPDGSSRKLKRFYVWCDPAQPDQEQSYLQRAKDYLQRKYTRPLERRACNHVQSQTA